MYKTLLKILTDSIKVKILYLLLTLFLTISFYFLINLQQKINNYQKLLNNTLLGPFGLLEIKLKQNINKEIIKEINSLKIKYILFNKQNTQLSINNTIKNINIIVWNQNYNAISNFLNYQFGKNINLKHKKHNINLHFKAIKIGSLLPYNTIFLTKKTAINLGMQTEFNTISFKTNIDNINNITNKISKILQHHQIQYKIINKLNLYYEKLSILKKMKLLKISISIVLYTLIVILLFFSFLIIYLLKKKSLKIMISLGVDINHIVNTFLIIFLFISINAIFINYLIVKNIIFEILLFNIFIIIISYLSLSIYLRKNI